MSKMIKGLFANIGIFSLTTFTSRFLSFLILPLYTFYLTTEEYGTIDLVNTVISLMFPVLSLSICDAVLRFGIGNNNDNKTIFSLGLNVILAGSSIGVVLIPLFLFFGIKIDIIFYGIVIFFFQGLNSLFASFCKAINETKKMALITLTITFTTLLLNVVLVAKLHMDINGYWISTILGNIVGLILYIYWCKFYKYYYFDVKMFKSQLFKEMLIYAIPLIPNALFWWINSSLDRLVLTTMTSVSIVGLYACANKIPTIISTISSIFSQAWTLSIFQSDSKQRKKFFEQTYLFYNEILFSFTIVVIYLSKFLGSLLFSKDFFVAWTFVPILTAGVYYNSLNSVIGSVFNAHNNSAFIFRTTVYGSLTNIILNIPLVYFYGAMGAAIATLISYFIVWIVRVRKIKQLYDYRINYRNALFQMLCLYIVIVFILLYSNWSFSMILVFVYCIYSSFKYLFPVINRIFKKS